MRTYLVFHQNGEISERICNCREFDMDKFKNFDHYKKYDRHIILYNDNEDKDYNITIFSFTNDKYKGDLGLIKLDKHENMKDLKQSEYTSKLLKTKVDPNELYYSSEEEVNDYSSLRL